MHPALLLDVDGVLCPFEATDEHAQHFFSEAVGLGGDWVYVSPKNAERLASLAESFELIWCTGWEHSANKHLLELHGLDTPLQVIEFWKPTEGVKVRFSGLQIVDPRFGMTHWKMPWVDAWARESNRPLVWLDDEVTQADIAWAHERSKEVPTLVVQVPGRIGLTDDNVADLKEWASDVAQTDGDGT